MSKTVFERQTKVDRTKFFEFSTNFEQFQKFLPQYYPSVRLISSRENIFITEEHFQIFERELVMMVKHIVEKPIKHEFFVIGGDAKGTHVICTYKNIPNGTNIRIEIDWKFNSRQKVKNFFKQINVSEEYSKIMDQIVLIAEALL